MKRGFLGLAILLCALSAVAGGRRWPPIPAEAYPCDFSSVGPEGKPAVASNQVEIFHEGKWSKMCIDKVIKGELKSDPKSAAIRLADASPEVLGEIRKSGLPLDDATSVNGGVQ